MFNSEKELIDKIRLGEATFLELKEVRFAGQRVSAPHRNAIADELASFANGHGGVCLLGVADDTREVLGIPLDHLDIVEAFVREICIDSITPPISPVIDRLWLPSVTGEKVAAIKIDVPRSLFVHQSPGGYFYRIGSAKRAMSPEYLARLFQQRSQARIIRFDEQIVPGASLKDLSPELCDRFQTPRTGDSQQDMLSKLHMARTDEDGVIRPTVAGVLMATDDAREWLPNAYIQAVAYRGTAIRAGTTGYPYQLDAADIFGPLDFQVADACQFVAKNMKVAAFKDCGRVDQPQFDMTAVFEAIVNAVAHRDYSIYGSKVRLRLFENRLELYSPGAIPNGMTVGSLPHIQASRNDVIASLLAKCSIPDRPWLTTDRRTMMDRRGEGVHIILDNSERLSGKVPQYRLIDDAELMLTIYAAGE